MNNIGYAVFGSPKGIAVVSNGLFKSLNLDKSLYLNNSHIVLDKGEQIIVIRRIPSNLNNLEQKDALLIALYENALQYGENRAGGFVGSAICFKGKMPNAEEMISGLVYLFSKMKENVDTDNRFNSIDADNWNVSLPDANKKFGLEESKLNYAPISSSNNNIVIKLNSLEKEAASLLYNFALNRSFHSVDYLYASTSNSVIEKMKPNGFKQLPLAELFNYNRYLSFFKDRLVKDDEKLKFINKNAANLQNKIAIDNNEAKRLEDKISSYKSELESVDKELLYAKNQLAEVVNKNKEVSRNTNFQRSTGVSNNNSMPNENDRKYEELRRTIAEASHKIREYSNIKITEDSNSDETRNKAYVDTYFEQMPKRKSKAWKKILLLFIILTVLLLTFIGLFIFKEIELNEHIAETEKKEQIVNAEKAEIAAAQKKSKEFLDKLNKFKNSSTTANHFEFRKAADDLLKNFIDDKNSDEYQFIVDHKWQFWEFDYKDDALVNRLSPNSKKTYFITIENEIKPLKPQVSWRGEDRIAEQLENYMKEPNDIYQNVNPEVLNDSNLIESHFKYVIEKENGKLEDLNIGQKIKLPFFKN